MGKYLMLIVLLTIGYSCKKEADSSINFELVGRYRGTFNRSTSPDTTQVTLYFRSDMRFEGTGGPNNFPAICGGTFQRNNNSLVVNDTCTWTANFDWTLIFDGSYNIQFTDENSVRLWRTNGSVTDEYLLNRFTR
jgi:hypothetical protein